MSDDFQRDAIEPLPDDVLMASVYFTQLELTLNRTPAKFEALLARKVDNLIVSVVAEWKRRFEKPDPT